MTQAIGNLEANSRLRTWQKRRKFPAWMMSAALHAAALVALSLLFHRAAVPAPEEPPRSAGIVLSRHAEDVAYFQPPAEKVAASQVSATSSGAASNPGSSSIAALPDPEAANGTTASPELPGRPMPAGAGLLQDVVASGGGRASILPGLGDAEILANDPHLNAPPQPELGPTATLKIFGATATGRSFIMLIDRSKSMGGDGLGAIEAAQQELTRAMEALSAEQKFQIVAYNQRLSANDNQLIPATDENKTKAEKFMSGIVAHGQTEHRMAILAALRNQPEVIYVFTDGGQPGLTQPDLRTITLRADGKTVIHCVQFGFGPLQEEEPFLRRLARLNGGHFAYVDVSQIGRRGNPRQR